MEAVRDLPAIPGDRPRHAADEALDLARGRTARPVTEAVQAAAIRRRIRIPLRFADDYSTTATVVSFTGLTDAQQHVALELGRPAAAGLPLVRLHSECLTGDVFGSQRCDCGPQLREAVERITKHGGYVLYLRQEGRGQPKVSNPHRRPHSSGSCGPCGPTYVRAVSTVLFPRFQGRASAPGPTRKVVVAAAAREMRRPGRDQSSYGHGNPRGRHTTGAAHTNWPSSRRTIVEPWKDG
jgi:hypothetical protein